MGLISFIFMFCTLTLCKQAHCSPSGFMYHICHLLQCVTIWLPGTDLHTLCEWPIMF